MQCNIAAPDLGARLNGTVCMYDGLPYYLMVEEGVPNPDILLYDFLSKTRVKVINSDDPKFDISTPPLGYMQVKPDRVAYAERLPHRQFRQGLTPQVLSYSYFGEQQRVSIHSEYFRDMILKTYRPLSDIISDLPKPRTNTAEFALNNDCALVVHPTVVKVYFRHEEVGFSSASELKKDKPVIHVPNSPKSWIAVKYLSQFDWAIAE